ncbi:MAG: hypothetical protein NTU83_13980, partial [Candidatus Hydrogenedentes bacterium]|nr:hypothetical protein [Candidatus Hydrogenedentota bacterium]
MILRIVACSAIVAVSVFLVGSGVAADGIGAPIDLDALQRAVADLAASYPEAYPNGAAYLERIEQYRKQRAAGDAAIAAEIAAFQREALLANPLVKGFERILVIRRDAKDPALGLPQNWQGNCSLPLTKYHNEIASFPLSQTDGPLSTLYKPEKTHFVGDVDLHFDGDRLLFSMPGSHERSQVWEIRVDGSGLRQVTSGDDDDVDNYDACYLPDGRIVYASTACYLGVPCVSGSDNVANLCIVNADGTQIRQICFDQDHDWCPTV